MSFTYTTLVLKSPLPPRLKLTAVALASYASHHDGASIYPSVETLSVLTSKSERQVIRDLTELERLGVLVPLTPRKGGRGKVTHYRLDRHALKPDTDVRDQPDENPDTDDGVSSENPGTDDGVQRPERAENPDTGDVKPRHGCPETPTPMTENPDMGVTRSVRIQQDPPENRAAATPPFELAKTKSAQAKEPSDDGNHSVVMELALTLLDQHFDEYGEKLEYGDLVEKTKDRCAKLGIGYDHARDSRVAVNVVPGACARALARWKLGLVHRSRPATLTLVSCPTHAGPTVESGDSRVGPKPAAHLFAAADAAPQANSAGRSPRRRRRAPRTEEARP